MIVEYADFQCPFCGRLGDRTQPDPGVRRPGTGPHRVA
ncbi:hypothetical protein ABZ807_19640 [Micromonospora sp. NPDC047548]